MIDLEFIFSQCSEFFRKIQNNNIFITGGTGFFGCWFLETLLYVNKKINLNIKITVLTRNFEIFKNKAPHLANNPSINFHIGDIRNFNFQEQKFDFILHCAGAPIEENRINRFDIFTKGTRNILEFAKDSGCKKVLFTSSGSVYGKKHSEQYINEDLNTIPAFKEPYAELGLAKRIGEFFCYEYSKHYNFEAKIARCFTFVGPYLPLDKNYAIGNFIRDAMNGGPIVVKGDGTAVRSYMYASDLMIWLWTILFKGKNCEPYNVGSEEEITIKELAFKVAEIYKKLTGKTVEVIIQEEHDPTKPVDRYVPSTKKAKTELGLKQTVSLEDAIEKTFLFYLSH